MRTRTSRIVVVAALTIGAGTPAYAQKAAPAARVRVGVNAGVQPTSTSFGGSSTQTVHLEQGVVDAAYEVRHGMLFDGGMRYRIAGGFGVGAAVSWFSARNDARVTAAIPHPFFFRTPRSIDGAATQLRHEEIVTHLQAVYSIRPTARVDVAFGAGPSFFRVSQALVDGVNYSDAYPYDAPAFTSAASTRVSGRKTGYNAGTDVAIRLARHAGVGAAVRFSRARTALAPAKGAAVTIDAGGLQVGGGVRLYF